MNDDKSLHLTKNSTNYLGENNAEDILLILPITYNDTDLRDCSITLHWINQNSSGNVTNIILSEELYKASYYQSKIPITIAHTFMVGNIEIWIEVMNPDINLAIKTSTIKIPVLDHKNVQDYIPEQQLALFPSYIMQMEELNNTATNILSGVSASENNAKTSETNSKASENNSKTSETNTKASESIVVTIQENLSLIATNAETATTNANTAAINAQNTATKLAEIVSLNRKFKPKLGSNPFLTTTSILTNVMTDTQIIEYVTGFTDAGIESISILIDIEPYESDPNTFVIMETLPKLKLLADTALSLGLSISALKFHNRYATQNLVTINKLSWYQQHKAHMISVFDLFQGYNIPYCCVLNEAYTQWEDAECQGYIIDLIATAKLRGYKVGMTGGLTDVRYRMPITLIDEMDTFMFNIYPSITNLDNKATLEDGLVGWQCSKTLDYLLYYKQLYPEKNIIISETGIQSNWQALAYPAQYVWTEPFDISGEPVSIYLYGMFEYLKDAKIVEEVWWLYDVDFPIVQKMIKKYLGVLE
jgi:hypothetical protein